MHRIFEQLKRLMGIAESFYHPSNSGSWSEPLALFLLHLSEFFSVRRGHDLKYNKDPLPEKEIVSLLMGVVWQALYSKSQHTMTMARDSLKFLARKLFSTF